MKKFLIVSNVVLLGIIILSNRGSSQKTSGVSSLIDTCESKLCQGYLNNNVQEFESNITYEMARLMSHIYKADRGKRFICNGPTITNKEDASSIVFDLALLKKYIWYIENNLCKKCSDPSLQLGIRFYYAKYPQFKVMQADNSLKVLDSSYANRHTLFMVPVLRHLFTKEKWKNFNPGSVGENCDLSRAFNLINKRWILAKVGDLGDDGSQENHGSLRPPPAGSGEFPEN